MGIDKIRQVRERLQRLPLETLVGNAVARHTGDIEEFAREQLLAGRGKDGERLTPYASKAYANKKSFLNPAAGKGNPDLRLTGNFHDSIEARAYSSYVEIEARDFKAKYLTPKYPNAVGLNIFNVIRLQREFVLPFLRTAIKPLLLP